MESKFKLLEVCYLIKDNQILPCTIIAVTTKLTRHGILSGYDVRICGNDDEWEESAAEYQLFDNPWGLATKLAQEAERLKNVYDLDHQPQPVILPEDSLSMMASPAEDLPF